ncbi:fetal and adult testis-expressed transcript protein [Rhinopithecus roxellana]|uniref:Fetal and adult testis expressed 1 n=2 Tax=Rhinopithecus TaxID=542827 RepID=A0A2K6JU60_RHIBE|nr:fetal and adult testis-expressed transcript protein [Rhinopithecus roxellana]XP_017739573.1 PREDICTED: fetal and adult testis-expressed transcript protein [Rhinopithecus bieti]XP_030790668.1 fetal and adult testis-expressed transcript protein [Rhinopithecus roxellana]
MAGGPPNTKAEMEMSLTEELNHGRQGQNPEHLVIAEMMEHGSRSLGASQKRQKLEQKAAGSASAKRVWNMTATRSKKMGSQLPMPRMLRESGHGDAHLQEYPGNFQGMRFHYDRNPGTDAVAQTSLEELNVLEMEVMRRQLYAVNRRLRALEDQGATWRQRETLIIAVLVSASIANLWLWMNQ